MVSLLEKADDGVYDDRVGRLFRWQDAEVRYQVQENGIQCLGGYMTGNTHAPAHTESKLMFVRRLVAV